MVPIAVIKDCGQRQLVVRHPGSQGRNMETGAGAEVMEGCFLLDGSPSLAQSAPRTTTKAGTAYVSVHRPIRWVHYVSVTLTVLLKVFF